jgi:hypothetical protein
MCYYSLMWAGGEGDWVGLGLQSETLAPLPTYHLEGWANLDVSQAWDIVNLSVMKERTRG